MSGSINLVPGNLKNSLNYFKDIPLFVKIHGLSLLSFAENGFVSLGFYFTLVVFQFVIAFSDTPSWKCCGDFFSNMFW